MSDKQGYQRDAKSFNRYALSIALYVITTCLAPPSTANQGLELHVASPAQASNVNYTMPSGIWDSLLVTDLQENLVRYNAARKRLEAAHAKSWQRDTSGLLYTFTLQDNLRWNDGKRIEAKDYVRAWRYHLTPETLSVCADSLSTLEHAQDVAKGKRPPKDLGVKALTPNTLEVRLSTPDALFLHKLAISHCYVLPFHRQSSLNFQTTWNQASDVPASGPYQLQSDLDSKLVILEENPHYWDRPALSFKRIVWHSYPAKDNHIIEDMLAGRIHIAIWMSANPNTPWMLKNRPGWCLKTTAESRLEYLQFSDPQPNRDSQLHRNALLREAISMSVHREALSHRVLILQTQASYSLAPAEMYAASAPQPTWAFWTLEQRRQRAREILRSLGYTNDAPLQITLRINKEKEKPRIANALVAMWHSIGIQAKVRLSDVQSHYQALGAGDFEVARAGWLGTINSPLYYLQLLDDRSHHFPKTLKLSGSHQALREIQHSTSDTAAEALMLDLEQRNQAESILIPLYHTAEVTCRTPRLQHFKAEAWWYRDIKNMRWREE